MFNIYSGEKGLGAALTNPTELARKKGCITKQYSVVFRGRTYPDAETAYHALKTLSNPDETDAMMIELIGCKFRQHPALFEAVEQKGGADWLTICSHLTGAKSSEFSTWEGHGLNSRFIRNLVKGYLLAASSETIGEEPQLSLF